MVTGAEGTIFQPSIHVQVLLSLEETRAITAGLAIGTDYVTDSNPPTATNNYMVLRISDLYVSPSGSDYDLDLTTLVDGGDGTRLKPYRTIQRALDRALINARNPVDYSLGPYGLAYGQPGATGSDRQFNRDMVIVLSGIYMGPGNVALRPRGKLVTIRSEWTHLGLPGAGANGLEVTVDCQNSGFGFIEESGERYWDSDSATERDSIYVQGLNVMNCLNRRVYSVYDPVNKRNTLHRNPYTYFHRPEEGRQKAVVHTFGNRFRPGWRPDPNLVVF
jgi:hypothetical protein